MKTQYVGHNGPRTAAPEAGSPPGGRPAEPAAGKRARSSTATYAGWLAPPLTQLVVLFTAGLLWWLAALQGPKGAIPTPLSAFTSLAGLLGRAEFWDAVRETASTWAVSLLICTAVGIPAGLAIGLSRFVANSTRLVVDFLRTIPPVALMPLYLLVYGPTRDMVIVLVVSGAVWPLVIQSVYAAGQTEPQLKDVARSFGFTRWVRLRHVFVPSVLPFAMTGIRVAATLSLLLTVTGELLGGAPGLGMQIENALNGENQPQMYAYVLTTGALGLVVNSAFHIVQHRVLRWHPSVRGSLR
ncbi:ABC transporter permease [Streptomyces sp. NPDC051320]|uniref:ABC transporter permease n=1 Tax=Streptomyces sp. NPDC051320 TaxID=3154644 RepID=UPI0034424260